MPVCGRKGSEGGFDGTMYSLDDAGWNAVVVDGLNLISFPRLFQRAEVNCEPLSK